jgi:regulator of RNase E activity RraA
MDHPVVDPAVLDALRTLDTPTVCNALEVVAPERRGHGYTIKPLVCTRPELPPMVGYARTATISAVAPSDKRGQEARDAQDGYYAYMASGPNPTITVIHDLDGDQQGYGAFWGEVNTNVHKGLGSLGLITDGSVRDLPDVAEGFQMIAGSVGPSHAFVHPVAFNVDVNIHGMKVGDGDLIHADQHGCVVVPIEVAAQVKEAADAVARREAVIIKASQQPGFDMDALRKAWGDAAEIH